MVVCGAALAAPFAFLLALLRWVPDVEDFDGVFPDAIGDDVRELLMQEFASPFRNSRTSTIWKFPHGKAGLSYCDHCRPRQVRLVLSKIVVDLLQIACSSERPADAHQDWIIRSMRASISLSSTKSPRVCLLHAFPHGGAEASVPFQQAQGGFLY